MTISLLKIVRKERECCVQSVKLLCSHDTHSPFTCFVVWKVWRVIGQFVRRYKCPDESEKTPPAMICTFIHRSTQVPCAAIENRSKLHTPVFTRSESLTCASRSFSAFTIVVVVWLEEKEATFYCFHIAFFSSDNYCVTMERCIFSPLHFSSHAQNNCNSYPLYGSPRIKQGHLFH